jgi:hypothetical protein
MLHLTKDNTKFGVCLQSSQHWSVFAEEIIKALSYRDQLKTSLTDFDTSTLADHDLAVKHVLKLLKERSGRSSSSQGITAVLLYYEELSKEVGLTEMFNPKTIRGFLNLMQRTLLKVEAKAVELARFYPAVQVIVDSSTINPSKKPKLDNPETVAAIAAGKEKEEKAKKAAAAKAARAADAAIAARANAIAALAERRPETPAEHAARMSRVLCHNCQELGHYRNHCPKPRQVYKPPGGRGELGVNEFAYSVCAIRNDMRALENITYSNNSSLVIVFQEEEKKR